ncbi:MAG TPA: AAA family ATPase [Clostridia bacterium]|nr:AAA family ATPase [Clostridia bacterium]
MAELSVVVLAPDEEQKTILQIQVDGTAVARTVQSFAGYPVGATDLTVRRIQDALPHVIVVDIERNNSSAALRAIELLRAEVPKATIFAVGDTGQPQVIINTMRAGAREFLQRPTTTTELLEAFVRASSTQRQSRENNERGKVIAVCGTKGGSGATTIAVNTSLALNSLKSGVVLVDLAPLGHAALHLNARPAFTVSDAIRNAHRLDHSLLEGYMTRLDSGLQLLAGVTEPLPEDTATADVARLFDLLVQHFRYVVVDASSRLDRVSRVVCDLSDTVLLVGLSDVASLWSAAKVQRFFGEGTGAQRLRLVMNRFRKIPGFSDSEIETTTGAKILLKIPNEYAAVSVSIDRGMPVVQQNHSEISRSFAQLARLVSEPAPDTKPKNWPLTILSLGKAC